MGGGVGAGEVGGFPFLKIKNCLDLANCNFMFLGRCESHIQAFVNFINGKLSSSHSSSSTFHDSKIYHFIKKENQIKNKYKIEKWTPEISEISKIVKSQD